MTTIPPETTSSAKSLVSARAAYGREVAEQAMRKTRTKSLFQTLAMAWPGIDAVVERLSIYLTDQVPDASGQRPLLHLGLERCGESLGNYQEHGLNANAIRLGVAGLLVTSADARLWQVCRGDHVWNPALGIPLSDFIAGSTPHTVRPCSEDDLVHRDDVIREVGHYILTKADQRALNRDVRRLVVEYRQAWPHR